MTPPPPPGSMLSTPIWNGDKYTWFKQQALAALLKSSEEQFCETWVCLRVGRPGRVICIWLQQEANDSYCRWQTERTDTDESYAPLPPAVLAAVYSRWLSLVERSACLRMSLRLFHKASEFTRIEFAVEWRRRGGRAQLWGQLGTGIVILLPITSTFAWRVQCRRLSKRRGRHNAGTIEVSR